MSNLYRWNRTVEKNRDKFDVLVFTSSEIPDSFFKKFPNVRFWRLHQDFSAKPVSLLNEAIRNSRKEILVYVPPHVLVRKNDLYCMANRVREDYTLSWAGPRRRVMPRENFFRGLWAKILWLFNSGRKELYSHMNHPYDFFDGPLLAFNKKKINDIFKSLEDEERISLLRADSSSSGALNFYFSHLLNRHNALIFNEGCLRSYQFDEATPGIFFSWKNTLALIRVLIRERDFHYPINVYRALLPVMQLTQLSFFVLVWFYPVKSLSLVGFYMVLGSGLFVEVFRRRKKNSVLMFVPWFFSWLFA